jgi:phage terminase small subunit
MRDLTGKQQKFVETYLSNGRNAAAAYRAAYNTKGSNYRVAHSADKLLKHPEIARILAVAAEKAQKAIARVIDEYEVTEERVTRELALIAFANMGDYMKPGADGDPVLDFSSLTREQMAALTEVTVESYMEGGKKNPREVKRVKFKLADKRAALVDLGRKLKMFTDRTEHNVVLSLEHYVQKSMTPTPKTIDH